jgi:hypothetical protein
VINIGFCGFICSGKTCISTKFKEKYNGRIESIATPLKLFGQEILNTIFDGLLPNYKKIRKPEHRDLLVLLGEKLRDPNFGYSDFWIEKINLNKETNESIFIDDIRHPNEATFLKANKFVIVRLDVSEEEQIKRANERDGSFDSSIRNHHSEQNHLNIKPDIIVKTDNKSTEEVVKEIERQLTSLLKLKIIIRSLFYKILIKLF